MTCTTAGILLIFYRMYHNHVQRHKLTKGRIEDQLNFILIFRGHHHELTNKDKGY